MTVIAGLRADKVRIPFRRPFVTAGGMWVERDAWIVRLLDRDGRVGVGEAVLEPADGDTAAVVLDHLVREAASSAQVGALPSAPELELHGAPGRALRAAIDAARLDLDQHPSPRLGPRGPGVGVNATLPAVGPAASAEAARQALEAGFTTLKLKAGAERETEVLVDRVAAVRSAVGPGTRLRLDVNGAWDLDTAIDRLAAIRRYAIEYVEQPIAGDDAGAMAEVRRRAGVPVAVDEAVTSVRAVRALLDAEAVDVLVVKPVRVGGPVAAAEIADLATERGIPVVVSTLFETGIGIAAGLAVAAALPEAGGGELDRPHDHGLATAGLLDHDLLAEGLPLDKGRMWVPGGSAAGGLGIMIDERVLARYVVDTAEAS